MTPLFKGIQNFRYTIFNGKKNSKNEFKRQLKSHCNVQKMLAALLNMHIFMTI